MSAQSKGLFLRILVPSGSSEKILASLGQTQDVQRKDIALNSGRMTTDEIVRQIRELGKVRDELLHAIRQFGVRRDMNPAERAPDDPPGALSLAQQELEEKRSQHQELQSRIDSLQRQLDALERQLGILREVEKTGFSTTEVASEAGNFARILGRIPTKKVLVAQRELETALKDEVVVATGARSKDNVYVLVAVPREKTSQALQTLMLNDFVQTETNLSEDNLRSEGLEALESKKKRIQDELETNRDFMKKFQSNAYESLNTAIDLVQDTQMALRGLLKLGEGSKASLVIARLSKPIPLKTINSIRSQGALVEIE